jgi:hypothetical protein
MMREGEGGCCKAMLLMLRGAPFHYCRTRSGLQPLMSHLYAVNMTRGEHAVMTGRELKYAPRMNK